MIKRGCLPMKFLLVAVNAKYIHSNPAIYSLYAYSEEAYAQNMEIAEYTINQRAEDILAQIYERKPDAIGFSCYIWNWGMICELLADISKVLPKADIWLGGPQVSYDPKRVLEAHPNVKGIMVGEGEETFRELLTVYNNPGENDFLDIAGLYLRSGYTAQREVTDLNKIPFLYHSTEPFRNRIIYYESSRGCPYRCSYCLSSIDKKVRLRDMELVKKELQFFLDSKVPQVKFVDRTFNCVHKHAMEIWQYLHEHDNGITNFHFEIAADIINEEELALLRTLRPGQIQLEIGVQSVNEQTLAAINRRMDLKKLEYVVATIRSAQNIHQHLDLIAGLPYEDYESFGRSFDCVYAMQPDQLQLGFLKVLSGAPIAQQTEEFGIFYTDQPPYEVLYTKWLSYPEVIRLKKIEEMVELYYNSNQFIYTLRQLVKAFSSPFAMFEELADFYEKNGYFTNSPARAYRYEVLLHFATEYDGEKKDLYAELLTYDLYLRENMKTRPGFCRSLNEEAYKKYKREFYRDKEFSGITHLEKFSYPVWKENAERTGTEYYVLFEYDKRNPLTKEAYTSVIF